MVRDYREVQVSSTALVVIILGIILLGAVIFFIGVQVGKKQADLVLKTMTAAQKAGETISPPVAVPQAEETTAATVSQTVETSVETPDLTQTQTNARPAEQPASKPASSPATSPPKTTTSAPRPVATPSGTFFIQVGAFNDQPSARLEAEKYRKQGYTAVVKEPFARDRKPLFRVWLGGYKSREEAQKALSELVSRSARNPGFFIVQQ